MTILFDDHQTRMPQYFNHGLSNTIFRSSSSDSSSSKYVGIDQVSMKQQQQSCIGNDIRRLANSSSIAQSARSRSPIWIVQQPNHEIISKRRTDDNDVWLPTNIYDDDDELEECSTTFVASSKYCDSSTRTERDQAVEQSNNKHRRYSTNTITSSPSLFVQHPYTIDYHRPVIGDVEHRFDDGTSQFDMPTNHWTANPFPPHVTTTSLKPISTSQDQFDNAYQRKRASLVEALNNSIELGAATQQFTSPTSQGNCWRRRLPVDPSTSPSQIYSTRNNVGCTSRVVSQPFHLALNNRQTTTATTARTRSDGVGGDAYRLTRSSTVGDALGDRRSRMPNVVDVTPKGWKSSPRCSLPSTPEHRSKKQQQPSSFDRHNALVERIYCVRQVLQKVSEDLLGDADNNDEHRQQLLISETVNDDDDTGTGNMRLLSRYRAQSQRTAELDQQHLDLPPRLMRTKRDGRRSKSQPMHSPSIDNERLHSDDDADTNHIARLDALNCSELSDGSSKPSYRSSVHSTSSSMTSGASSDEQPTSTNGCMAAEAVWDNVAMLPDELPFAAYDVIKVHDWSSHSELWFGTCHDRSGWFPSSHVRLLTFQSNIAPVPTTNVTTDNSSNNSSSSADFPESMRYLRSKIIQELVSTERDYVTLLHNLVEGFLHQAQRRVELFSTDRLRTIFGNLEAIFDLHRTFCAELQSAFIARAPENSCQNKFSIYSDYCNNRPVSCAQLLTLSTQAQYHQFFEACRLLRGMPKLSLEGFLLTPVQRICKYCLLLRELLKATPESHPDHASVDAACNAMRSVANDINDKKRRLESLQKIALWQRMVDGWRGADLLENNCQMLHSGDLTCRAMQNGNLQFTKDVVAFLFDQTLVLCKRDLLRRNMHIFKDRIALNSPTTSLIDVKDGKDPLFGVSVKNAFKLIIADNRQYLFSCRDRKSKRQWIETFTSRDNRRRDGIDERPPTSEERRLVAITINSGSGSTLSTVVGDSTKRSGSTTIWH